MVLGHLQHPDITRPGFEIGTAIKHATSDPGSGPQSWGGVASDHEVGEGQANEALGRFADLYDSGHIPEFREVVDTIVAWGEEILAYHSSRRASNGPLEGINNLLQVLRRVAHGFTNYDNYAARGILLT